MKIFLTIFIAVLQLLIVIIPLLGKLADNRYKFPKKFTKRGYVLIICCIGTVISTAYLFIISEDEQNNSQAALSKQIRISDSIHQLRTVETGKEYIKELDISHQNTLSALAKYGLRYDSRQQRIENLLIDTLSIVHERKVNLLLTRTIRREMALFLDLKDIDKIGDLDLYIIGNGSKVSLLNRNDFVYYKETIYTPLILIKDIYSRIADFKVWAKNFDGKNLVLEWRDGQNIPHKKVWDFKKFEKYVNELESGFIRSPTSNAFLSQIML